MCDGGQSAYLCVDHGGLSGDGLVATRDRADGIKYHHPSMTVDDLTGKGVKAYDFQISFDP